MTNGRRRYALLAIRQSSIVNSSYGAKAGLSKKTCFQGSVLNFEHPWKLAFPALIRDRHILSRIALDPRSTRHMSGYPRIMDEGGTGTGKILHAQKHLIFLSRGSHQHRLALPLAGFESNPGITHFARKQQGFEIRK